MGSGDKAVATEDVDRAEDLFRLLVATEARWKPDPTSWAFRGQADATWRLVPSILRGRPEPWLKFLHEGERRDAEANRARDFLRHIAEFKVVHAFMVAADRAGLAVPDDGQHLRSSGLIASYVLNDEPVDLKDVQALSRLSKSPWPTRHFLSIVALAQHYGVPTRLLDWTWKPRVAAYFAAREAALAARTFQSERLVVWALDSRFVTWIGRRRQQFDSAQLVTAPQASNPNLSAQAGLFTVVRDEHEDVSFDDVVTAGVMGGAVPGWLTKDLPVMWKLTLPHSEARRLLRLLGLDGVTAASVFPGYAGVSLSLQEREIWEE